MELKNRRTAIIENIEWFSRLSPSRKIRALERFRRQVAFLRKLQTASGGTGKKESSCAPSR
ncbi:MAG: hypothetical protein OHK006_21130 [Thermodesulfovibrionales bacterium]